LKIRTQQWGYRLIRMPYNSLFNAAWGHLFKKSHQLRSSGGLNQIDDALTYRSEKLLRVNDSFSAFMNDMRADGLNPIDIQEILEMLRRR